MSSSAPITLHTFETAREYLNARAPGVFSKLRVRFIMRRYGYKLGNHYVVPEPVLDAILAGHLPMPKIRHGRIVE